MFFSRDERNIIKFCGSPKLFYFRPFIFYVRSLMLSAKCRIITIFQVWWFSKGLESGIIIDIFNMIIIECIFKILKIHDKLIYWDIKKKLTQFFL